MAINKINQSNLSDAVDRLQDIAHNIEKLTAAYPTTQFFASWLHPIFIGADHSVVPALIDFFEFCQRHGNNNVILHIQGVGTKPTRVFRFLKLGGIPVAVSTGFPDPISKSIRRIMRQLLRAQIKRLRRPAVDSENVLQEAG